MTAHADTANVLLGWARRELQAAGIEDGLLEARVLLAHALRTTREDLLRLGDVPVEAGAADRYRVSVARRAAREPLAYLTGRREFYGRAFAVAPGVLVPRPETEMLVELAVERLRAGQSGVLVDVGAGSGCIAVSAAAEGWERVLAVDIQVGALAAARENAREHGVDGRVAFVRGDLLGCVATASADLVLSNPPYIPTADIEALQPEVRDHEPRVALDGGPDGLACYRRLLADARRVLRPGGVLAVEVGAGQAPSVRELMDVLGYALTETRRDLAGIERVVLGVWTG